MNWKHWAALMTATIATAYMWKGRAIRGQLSMMGEGWDRLHPDVQRRAVAVLRDAQLAGLNVGVFEGWRSRTRQLEVMKRGTSWTGDADSSYHRWGLAVDFVFLDRLGRWTWEPAGGMDAWHQLGEIIERHGFEWGGRWSTFDGPHAQLPVMRIAQLKQQYGTPEAVTWA